MKIQNYNEKKQSKVFIITSFLILIIISSILSLSISVFILQILFGSITILLLLKKKDRLSLIYCVIFFCALTFMFLTYSANLQKYGTPYFNGGSDDLEYEIAGKYINEVNIYNPKVLLEEEIIPNWHNSAFYISYIGILFKFATYFDGYTHFLPLISNIYLLIWATMILEYFLKKYANFDEKRLRWVIILWALTPNILYINSHVFRDILNLFQLLSIMLLFDLIISKKNNPYKLLYIFLFPLLIFITYYTRANTLFFSVIMCILLLGEKIKINRLVLISISIIVMFLLNEKFNSIEKYLDVYSNLLAEQATGLSSFIFQQPLLPLGIILRGLYAFITPFPDILNLFQNPDNLLFDILKVLIYFGVVLQIISIPYVLKRVIRIDFISLVFLVLFIGVITTTFTFRHVVLYYPFMVALAIDGIFSISKNLRIKLLYFILFVAICLLFIYLFLKILS